MKVLAMAAPAPCSSRSLQRHLVNFLSQQGKFRGWETPSLDSRCPELAGRRARLSADDRTGTVKNHFREFARSAAYAIGTPWAFVAACAIIIVWAASGIFFQFSDTWQLVINTGTTIITFLAVFLIQNTQNRDATAIHLKLDELIRSLKSARNWIIDLENCTDEEIAHLQEQFERLRRHAERRKEPETKKTAASEHVKA